MFTYTIEIHSSGTSSEEEHKKVFQVHNPIQEREYIEICRALYWQAHPERMPQGG